MLKTTIWLTGLPCSGKTTIAKRLKQEIENKGYNVVHLDGDDVREKLNKDLNFSPEHRKENLRRIAHVAKLLNENKNLVIASFVSPANDLRKLIQDIIGNVKLVHIKCGLEECERRDVKGMYEKARKGEIPNFTGIDAPFEEPENAHLVVNTEGNDLETCVEQIIKHFKF
ncbi:MAG: adenylyl-sulfate kinase [Nanoarchaeota archaeon]